MLDKELVIPISNVLHQHYRVFAVVGTCVTCCITYRYVMQHAYSMYHARLISQVCMLRYLFFEVLTELAMPSEALGSLTTSCMQREAMQCQYYTIREQQVHSHLYIGYRMTIPILNKYLLPTYVTLRLCVRAYALRTHISTWSSIHKLFTYIIILKNINYIYITLRLCVCAYALYRHNRHAQTHNHKHSLITSLMHYTNTKLQT